VACRGLYSATTRNVKNISYGNFATVAFAADISNKQVPDDTTYALFAVDNLGNFTHNLSAATSNLIKNVFSVSENVFALSLQDKLSVMICNEKGEIYGDISTLKNSNLNYLISESEVFDMQLTPLLSLLDFRYQNPPLLPFAR